MKAEMAMISFFHEGLLERYNKEMHWSAVQMVNEDVGREDPFVELEKGYFQG